MKSSRGVVYFIVCLMEYLVLFALECAVLEFFAPLFFAERVPRRAALPFLIVINPLVVWLTAEPLMRRFGKDLETK